VLVSRIKSAHEGAPKNRNRFLRVKNTLKSIAGIKSSVHIRPIVIKTQHTTAAQGPTWYRGFIQGKTRVFLAWIFAALLIFSARSYPTLPGILVCFLGASIRYWASGYLRKDNRIAVGGPYRMIRNPLYLGTYLMAVGTALAIEAWPLLILTSAVFAAVYHYIILDEETKLRRIFGLPYEKFIETVPRFFPRLWAPMASLEKMNAIYSTPNQASQKTQELFKFSKQIAKKNKALEAYWSFFALMGLVTLIAFLWQKFGL
jgi:protein-S-isoprenylcysteine O-methyltransferase Ste14